MNMLRGSQREDALKVFTRAVRPLSGVGSKDEKNSTARDMFGALSNGQRWLVAVRGADGVRALAGQIGLTQTILPNAIELKTCETTPDVKPGHEVELHGLTARAELNGKRGVLLEYLPDRSRWVVLLGDEEMAIKYDNCSRFDQRNRLTLTEWETARNRYLRVHRARLTKVAMGPGCKKSVHTLARDAVEALPLAEQRALVENEIPQGLSRAKGRFAKCVGYSALKKSQRNKLVNQAADQLADGCKSVSDAEQLLRRVLDRLEAKFPDVKERVRNSLNRGQACCCRPAFIRYGRSIGTTICVSHVSWTQRLEALA
jgi:hypothetical protein